MCPLDLEPLECLPQTEGSRTTGDIVISMQIGITDVVFEARLVVMALQTGILDGRFWIAFTKRFQLTFLYNSKGSKTRHGMSF